MRKPNEIIDEIQKLLSENPTIPWSKFGFLVTDNEYKALRKNLAEYRLYLYDDKTPIEDIRICGVLIVKI